MSKTGKDAGKRVTATWTKRLSLPMGAVVVLAACGLLRLADSPDPAKAQQRGTTRSAPAATRPAARTRAATVPAPPQQTATHRTRKQDPVAIVNGQPIRRQQLAHECLLRYGKEVLESMVNKQLIWGECQRLGIAITDAHVEAEIERMAGKFGLSVDRWLTMLEQERSISPSKYRRDIIWPTLALRHLAAKQIVVQPQELREAFEAEYGSKVKVRLISVRSKNKADELWQRARQNPDDFGDLAKEYSEDANSAAARGLIPPIRKHVGPREVEQAAFALKEGEISPVIHVANQYLMLKCEGHIPENYIASTKLEQIEQQLHDQIRDQKLREAAGKLFQKLQQQAEIVNVLNNPESRDKMPGVAATVNGHRINMQELGEECLTRHGHDVLEGEINRLILLQELKRHGRKVTDAAIDEEIARAADAYGYLTQDGRPDVNAWLESVTESDDVSVDIYIRDAVWPSVALKALVGDQVEISDEDLQKAFIANYGERVEVLAIVLGNQRQANMVWEMARNTDTDQYFGELANKYSVEPVSKANFGKVPPIRQYGGQPVLEKEAFRLGPGELSSIVAVGDKYIILRCLGRTEPKVNDLSAVEDELKKDLTERKMRSAMAEHFDRLVASARVDNFLADTSQPGTARQGQGTVGATRAGRAALRRR